MLSVFAARRMVKRAATLTSFALETMADAPDLLIADLHLDHGSLGIDVIDALRLACSRQIPAVIITADRSDKALRLAEDYKCQLLNKPLKPAHLRALLSHMLENETL